MLRTVATIVMVIAMAVPYCMIHFQKPATGPWDPRVCCFRSQ